MIEILKAHRIASKNLNLGTGKLGILDMILELAVLMKHPEEDLYVIIPGSVASKPNLTLDIFEGEDLEDEDHEDPEGHEDHEDLGHQEGLNNLPGLPGLPGPLSKQEPDLHDMITTLAGGHTWKSREDIMKLWVKIPGTELMWD